MADADPDVCNICGKPLPGNWPLPYHSACLGRSRKPREKSTQKKIEDLGGSVRFREHGELDSPKWAVIVRIFGERTYGDGFKKEIAVRNAVSKLSPEIAKRLL